MHRTTPARLASCLVSLSALVTLGTGCDGDESLPAQPTLEPPDAPAVEALGPRNVQVSWASAPTGGAARLVVERREPAADAVTLDPIDGVSRVLDVGLEPDQDYQYRLCRRVGPDTSPCSEWVATSTPSAALETTVSVPVAYEAAEGADDVYLISNIDFEDQATYGALVIVDRAGRVLWEHVDKTRGFINDVELLDDGTIFFNQYAEQRLIDLYFRPIRRYVHAEHPAGLEAPGFEEVTVLTEQFYHHEADPFGSQAFLSLVFAQQYDEVLQRDVLGDGVVVFDRATGEDSWFLDLFDYYDVHDTYCPICIEDILFGVASDWTHANALWFDEQQSQIYINIRNLDRILVVDYPTGEVVREIGDGGVTFAHAHDPQYLDDGSILIFDNGLHRTSGGEYSRAVQFRQLPDGQLEEVWEYRESPDFFSPVMGDADRLANGHTLVTDGFNGRIVEVDPAGHKLWELKLDQPNHCIYKTNRISGARFRHLRGLD